MVLFVKSLGFLPSKKRLLPSLSKCVVMLWLRLQATIDKLANHSRIFVSYLFVAMPA
jgi:hypothetical protein